MTPGRPPESAGTVVVDLQALQSPSSRTHGIGRYAANWALAIERLRPDLVGTYLLNPDLPPPGPIEELVSTGKVAYRGAPDAISPRARVFHALSPFDLAVKTSAIWPSQADARDLVLSVTVYDLIPAGDPATELVDIGERRRYRTRLELVRSAAALQVLSAAVGEDLVTRLGVAPQRVHVVGAAPDDRFRPAPSHDAATEHAIRLQRSAGLARPYVLCPSGSHPRKNNERIVGAWSRLGDAAGDRQLVITGELPESTAHHLRHLASQTAAVDPVVVTGFVGDDDLVALYQGADLVCFPSLAEGFGLPVAEARACGVTVVCSDRPPLDELVAPENRFDPEDVDDIVRVIAAALGRHDPGAVPSRELGRIASWPEVAARSTEVFEDLVAGSARRARPRGGRQRALPRVAFVTPLPPAPSGVAAYNFRLIEELVATNEVTLDVFADGPTPSPTAPVGSAGVRSASARSRSSG